MQIHPVRQIVFEQGRTLTWVARQLGISVNYLHRILMPRDQEGSKPTPAWFYPRVADLLSKPEDALKPESEEMTAA